ncbi:MAG: putative selenium-dependent hydroxylase accessory protein YqeC [Spirochaetae bacterium HGW-Spirochaetae-7]|jgi:probable selenium-dependent hydroxylase accessory protein YqeC|nr:MAG: putative selenium-dependent hydroxylase accessory protein YqeC [Spirochaetae bacterium HGW-Spirochaetae-7]
MSFQNAEVNLFKALSLIYPVLLDGHPCIAAVGGGGKTGLLFSLADSLADRGLRVALTTTTHIMDPRKENGRRFDRVVLGGENAEAFGSLDPGITIIATGVNDATGQLLGIHPSRVAGLLLSYDAVLVEADGSKRLPVKAPAAHEPVMPTCATLVLGLVGLDCIGKPMDGRTVHRPEFFGPLVGCATGEPITAIHLRALAASPEGLFKGAPEGAIRVLVLNKADVLDEVELATVSAEFSSFPQARATVGMSAGFDAAILCSVRDARAHIIWSVPPVR